MIHKAWWYWGEVPFWFLRSSVIFQGHTAKQNRRFWPKLGVSRLVNSKMMHKEWRSIEEVPYYFSMSSMKFQGDTDWKIDDFNPISVRLPGQSQLSNPSDLLFFLNKQSSCRCRPCDHVSIFVSMFVSMFHLDYHPQHHTGDVSRTPGVFVHRSRAHLGRRSCRHTCTRQPVLSAETY